MNRRRAWSAAAATVCATVWMSAGALAGCGSAARPAADPSPATMSPEPAPLVTADDALVELERAESELYLALGAPGAPSEGAGALSAGAPGQHAPAPEQPAPAPPAAEPLAPPAAAPPAPRGTPDRAAEASRPTTADADAPAKKREAERVSAPPCETACRALASMERAAQHLCGLSGDADQRCDAARTRVKSATDRVATQCPRCVDR
ncbi:hypothetical protein SOCE26_045830 [Sorangium cellulosum]|uniref:Uncharacterized protein n=1 Tax=Sorangium cellulosum TaxID=56 RepID=A0A2L0EV09_SORCE|nr:hypothetical protein [Sorangium cellulosum]AUX43140.1 hypothetical protein SOCE26_045830 [Sorangium cellulosum]